MELEKKTIFWNRCRKSARPVGIFLALFLLWSGVLFPLGRKIQEGCRQQQQIQQQLQILAAFARQWDPQEAQEAARQLAGNGKELEAPQSREHWLEALARTADCSQIRCLRLLPLDKNGKTGEIGAEVVLEGSYPSFLAFFQQWEAAFPGTWTREGRLESREMGKTLVFQGKFLSGPMKSSKSR
ncbi:hypothetical protein [Acidaminococcus massiliensis]|jgi:hypothetical protein|uniref:hypothetical protein n=1 Tax=Acidaminococcus massiliensis TaxID=1852375 RepID=UPI00248E3602|nr:hypothetical protein [Acidaminococcus massiliensis]